MKMLMRANPEVLWVQAFTTKPVWCLGPIWWKARTDLCRLRRPLTHTFQNEQNAHAVCPCAHIPPSPARGRGSSEPPDVGAGNWSWVLSCYFSAKFFILENNLSLFCVLSTGVGILRRAVGMRRQLPCCFCPCMAHFRLASPNFCRRCLDYRCGPPHMAFHIGSGFWTQDFRLAWLVFFSPRSHLSSPSLKIPLSQMFIKLTV